MLFTIISVSYDHAPLLQLNMQWSATQNPNTQQLWLLTENKAEAASQWDTFTNNNPNLQISLYPGITPPKAEQAHIASIHHGMALDMLWQAYLAQPIRSRYVVILDPDFYVVAPNWMAQWPQQNTHAFSGVPWHPKYSLKCRDFPAPHCLLIDTQQLGPEFLTTLSFAPDFENTPTATAWQAMQRKKWPFWLPCKPEAFQKRVMRGHSRDTGYKLRQLALQHGYANQLLTPTATPKTDWPEANWLDTLLPDELSLKPKTLQTTPERFLTGSAGDNFEQFWWQSPLRPFGFHVRGFGKTVDAAKQITTIKNQLQRFA